MSEPYNAPYLECPSCLAELTYQGSRGDYIRVEGYVYLKDPGTGILKPLPVETAGDVVIRELQKLLCGLLVGFLLGFVYCYWRMTP